uniref:lipoprotein lipase-like n=1 Tax=Myxine glutinosa TaxID=7769 RepID=UPI00358ECA40
MKMRLLVEIIFLNLCLVSWSGPTSALFNVSELFSVLSIGKTPAEKASTENTKFFLRLRNDAEADGCTFTKDAASITLCSFNVTAKTFMIVHGWSMSGLLEMWVSRLVDALHRKDEHSNVIVVDWLPLAQQHYPIAVANTPRVGKDIASLIESLHKNFHYPLRRIHLLGYSLGAHVSGYAGSYLNSIGKIGRITGMDPAGPGFEGKAESERLSMDDADFVDAVHTFTRGSLGLSIGIQQPVAHTDFYPNDGHFQPGCDLSNAYRNVATRGIFGITDTVKCEHERSIHLFIGSLLHESEASLAFQCSDHARFDRGVCLSCTKNRCNRLGYDVARVRTKRSNKLFLRTSAKMPFRVFHYQLKMHFFSGPNEEPAYPSMSISLHGTRGDSLNVPLTRIETIKGNHTYSFLVHTDTDLGELRRVKLSWDGTSAWHNVWKQLSVLLPWPPSPPKNIFLRRLRIKAGETQERLTFCSPGDTKLQMYPGVEYTFDQCQRRQAPRLRHRRV